MMVSRRKPSLYSLWAGAGDVNEHGTNRVDTMQGPSIQGPARY